MTEATPPVTNFTGGELSSRLQGRVDVAKYFNGCTEMENAVSLPHGPFTRRPGTKYIEDAISDAGRSRLLPFVFAEDDAYVLEFCASAMHWFVDGGQLVADATDTVITNGAFPSGITDWDDKSGGSAAIAHDATNDRLSLAGSTTDLCAAEQDVTVAAGDQSTVHVLTFEIFGAAGDEVTVHIDTATAMGGTEIASRACGPGSHSISCTPGTGTIYVTFHHSIDKTLQVDNVAFLDDEAMEIISPFAVADVPALYPTSQNDVLYAFESGYHPRKLTRFDSYDWSLEEVAFIDGPYLTENVTAITLTPSAAMGYGVTLTASAALFASTDVGRLVRWKLGANPWGWMVITAFTSATVVTADIRSTLTTAAAVTTWRLGAWSDTTGWPICGSLHQQRLFTGGAGVDPARFDASLIGDYEDFTPGTDDDDSLSAVADSGTLDAVRWLSSAAALLMGTASNEQRVGDPNGTDPITPASVRAKKQTKYGSAVQVPVEVANRTLFIQARGRKVRAMIYSFESDQFVADEDLTLYAEHITLGGISELAYQQEPWSLLWGIRGDGVLLCCTYDPSQKVNAWHRHPIGGTSAVVESICVIPGAGDDDQLWLQISRTINGGTSRTIELLQPFFPDGADLEDAWFVDSGVAYSGAAADTISGLDHLEGATLQVLGDGATHPDVVVSSGAVTLDRTVEEAKFGLAADLRVVTVRLEAGAQGTAQGKKMSLVRTVLRFYRSLGGKIGRIKDDGSDDLETLSFRKPTDLMDTALPLYSDDKSVTMPNGWKDGRIVVVNDQPLPMTVVAMFPKLEVSED